MDKMSARVYRGIVDASTQRLRGREGERGGIMHETMTMMMRLVKMRRMLETRKMIKAQRGRAKKEKGVMSRPMPN